jgi:hypothetical protein
MKMWTKALYYGDYHYPSFKPMVSEVTSTKGFSTDCPGF